MNAPYKIEAIAIVVIIALITDNINVVLFLFIIFSFNKSIKTFFVVGLFISGDTVESNDVVHNSLNEIPLNIDGMWPLIGVK